MSYKSTRRQWVKLWVNEWLDGTTRFELTAPQRLVWIDLLALAGRSRFPGYVYAGEENGKKIGYPISYLAGVLQMDEVALNNALKLLEQHEHITLEEVAPEKYVIGIIKWEKYQSEYLRQKAYRKVTTKTPSRLPVEGEEEGEVDVEGEGEKRQRKKELAAAAFSAIGFSAPFGDRKFQKVFLRRYAARVPGEWLTEVMESTIQACQQEEIGIPPQFYEAKRDVEKRENGTLKRAVPL